MTDILLIFISRMTETYESLTTRKNIFSAFEFLSAVVMSCSSEFSMEKINLGPDLLQRGPYKVGEINTEVCPRLEFDNIMFIKCLGYDFYIYGVFEFLCNSIAN